MLLVLVALALAIGLFAVASRVCSTGSGEKEGSAVVATTFFVVAAVFLGLSCVRCVHPGYAAVRSTMFAGHKVIDEQMVGAGTHLSHPMIYYVYYPLEPRSVQWQLRSDSVDQASDLGNEEWLALLSNEIDSHPNLTALQITAQYRFPTDAIAPRCKLGDRAPRILDSVLYQSIQATMKEIALRAQGKEVETSPDEVFWQATRDQLKRDLDSAVTSTGAEIVGQIEVVTKAETTTTMTYGATKTKVPETEAINPAGYGG